MKTGGRGVFVNGDWRHVAHQTEQDTEESLIPVGYHQLPLSPGWAEAKASPVNGDCVGTVHTEGSSSSLDRAISVGRERWKCSQAWGWLVIPNSRGWAVGGNHDFYFSCGSKIMFSLGPEPHTLGCPAPC